MLSLDVANRGNLGSYRMANTGPFDCFHLSTFFKAFYIGIYFALFIADSTMLPRYLLSKRKLFNSMNLLSMFIRLVHALTILRLNENGIDLVTLLLRQLLGSKNRLLAVSFRYRKTLVLCLFLC